MIVCPNARHERMQFESAKENIIRETKEKEYSVMTFASPALYSSNRIIFLKHLKLLLLSHVNKSDYYAFCILFSLRFDFSEMN